MRGRVFSYRTEVGADGKSRTVKSASAKERSDKWAYEFAAIDPASGKRRSQSRGGFSGKQAAQRALAGAITEYEDRGRQIPVEPVKMTLSRFICDEWLPVTRTACAASTVENYEQLNRAYIEPHIGALPFKAVTSANLLTLFADLADHGGRNGAPLSKSTVRHVAVMLSAVFGYAVEAGFLRANPWQAIAKRAKPKQPKIDPNKLKYWPPTEATKFLASVADNSQQALYVLALTLGLRRGELSGLQWADIVIDDTTEPTLAVLRSRIVVGYAARTSTPKTRGSVRVLELDPRVVSALRAHRSRQRQERLASGSEWRNDENWVFTDRDGSPTHPQTISNRLQKAVSSAGVPWIGLHGLRHTSATLALSAGVPLKVVSERLGHASTAITADLYQHVIPGMQRSASSKISDALGMS